VTTSVQLPPPSTAAISKLALGALQPVEDFLLLRGAAGRSVGCLHGIRHGVILSGWRADSVAVRPAAQVR
jgi:hypothetical protein